MINKFFIAFALCALLSVCTFAAETEKIPKKEICLLGCKFIKKDWQRQICEVACEQIKAESDSEFSEFQAKIAKMIKKFSKKILLIAKNKINNKTSSAQPKIPDHWASDSAMQPDFPGHIASETSMPTIPDHWASDSSMPPIPDHLASDSQFPAHHASAVKPKKSSDSEFPAHHASINPKTKSDSEFPDHFADSPVKPVDKSDSEFPDHLAGSPVKPKQSSDSEFPHHFADSAASDSESDLASCAVRFAKSKVGGCYSQQHRDGNPCYDCSSLVFYAYKHCGMNIGATNTRMYPSSHTKQVPFSQIQAGDVLWRHGHVAMYVGGNRIVQASSPSRGIVNDPYKPANFEKVYRIH